MYSLVYENVMLPHGQNIGWRKYCPEPAKTIKTDAHFHALYEIMLFLDVNGSATVNSIEYSLNAGTLLFCPSLNVHSIDLLAGKKSFYLLQFEPHLIAELGMQNISSWEQGRVWHLDEQDYEWLASLFKKGSMINTKTSATNQRDLILKLILLFIEEKLKLKNPQVFVGSSGKSETGPSESKALSRLIPLLKHLDEKGKVSLSLDEAAEICGVTRFHFSRLFKSVFQVNFKDYLLKRRIASSITLLNNTDMSIADIAYACDFSDTAYFCSKFKQVMQQTPGEFRKQAVKTKEFQEG